LLTNSVASIPSSYTTGLCKQLNRLMLRPDNFPILASVSMSTNAANTIQINYVRDLSRVPSGLTLITLTEDLLELDDTSNAKRPRFGLERKDARLAMSIWDRWQLEEAKRIGCERVPSGASFESTYSPQRTS
jgi:hypothetical protein